MEIVLTDGWMVGRYYGSEKDFESERWVTVNYVATEKEARALCPGQEFFICQITNGCPDFNNMYHPRAH